MPEKPINPLLNNEVFLDLLRRVDRLEQENKIDKAAISSQLSRIHTLETSLHQAQADLRWVDIRYAYTRIKDNPHDLHHAIVQTYELVIFVLDYFKSQNFDLDGIKYAIRKEFLTDDQIEYIRLKYELDLTT